MAQRRTLLPLLALLAVAWVGHQAAFVAPGQSTALRGAVATRTAQQPGRTALSARGGEAATIEGEDSIELSGFSGFVVGLALLPHVCYALVTAFNVTAGNSALEFGPYGLEAVSCSVALGTTLWSLGSFVQRGRGLPAGPLGFLGLSEGLSYLAALGLAIAVAATTFRTGGPSVKTPSMPSMPAVSVPAFKAPEVPKFEAPKFEAPKIEVPKFEAPKIEVPKVKVPEFKAPDIKVPEIKAPKIPDIKVPEVKVPEVKVPEIKVPEKKVEEKTVEPEKPKVEEKKPEPKPAPKPEVKKPAAPKVSGPDYDMLFD